MCGILGYISKTSTVPDKERFALALSKQQYRGPDDSKIEEVQPNSLFGFNRLAIQDVSEAGMQPFSHELNRLIFNGEIYNWKELRTYLHDTYSVPFHTSCDTEVLAVGLSLEGVTFIEKLNGIFALCFWDASLKRYLLARDGLGVKPLFYTENESEFVFASDINSLLEYTESAIDTNTLQLHAFTDVFAGHSKTRTFFMDIFALKNGSIIELDERGSVIRESIVEKLDFHTVRDNLSAIESEFKDKLHTVFDIETRSDVPIGILLSGGIDSTAIMALATPALLKQQERIPVFTYAFQEKGENADLIAAESVIEELQEKYGDVYDLQYLNLDGKITSEDFRESVRARAMPVLDYRHLSSIKLYKAVHASGLKVVLNGQGSDELYYGYYPLDYWISRFFRQGSFNSNELIVYYKDDQNKLKQTVYTEQFLAAAEASTRKHFDSLLETIPADIPKEKRIAGFFTETILQALLLQEDKGGMFSSIEVRVPLINSTLAKYIVGCDHMVNLVSTDSGRHLLRKALEGEFSKEIIDRPKSPAPKKKNYWGELYQIYLENKTDIKNSDLLKSMYKTNFLEDPNSIKSSKESYSFYGNTDDILLEMLGWFFFEQEYSLNK